ncbi:hypothetical protein V8F06_004598 [Rhypophila decipiens]
MNCLYSVCRQPSKRKEFGNQRGWKRVLMSRGKGKGGSDLLCGAKALERNFLAAPHSRPGAHVPSYRCPGTVIFHPDLRNRMHGIHPCLVDRRTGRIFTNAGLIVDRSLSKKFRTGLSVMCHSGMFPSCWKRYLQWKYSQLMFVSNATNSSSLININEEASDDRNVIAGLPRCLPVSSQINNKISHELPLQPLLCLPLMNDKGAVGCPSISVIRA